MESVNSRLNKELTVNRGLTPYAVAKALNVGVATVDNWLKGKKQGDGTYKLLVPKQDYIEKICKIYDLDIMYILTGEKNTNKEVQKEPAGKEDKYTSTSLLETIVTHQKEMIEFYKSRARSFEKENENKQKTIDTLLRTIDNLNQKKDLKYAKSKT